MRWLYCFSTVSSEPMLLVDTGAKAWAPWLHFMGGLVLWSAVFEIHSSLGSMRGLCSYFKEKGKVVSV